jgi:hypothetical protein
MLNLGYIIPILIDLDEENEGIRIVLALGMALVWARFTTAFRAYESTRYLLRIIFETLKGSLPFLLIFVCYVLAIAFSLMALRSDDNF